MGHKQTTINYQFHDEQALYKAYMPFVEGGGIFIATATDLPMGSLVELVIRLPNDSTDYQLQSKVVWVTPKGAKGNKPAGIGLQLLNKEGAELHHKIETLLADMLKSTQNTDTI